MRTSETDRLGEQLRAAPMPRGLGVDTVGVLREGHRARRQKTGRDVVVATLSTVGVAVAGVWAGGHVFDPQQTATPATEDSVRSSLAQETVRVTDIYTLTRDEQLADLAKSMGIESPPTVEVIREVTPQEAVEVTAQCMAGAGWGSEDGVYTIRTEQEDAFVLAQYRCAAAYPVDEGLLDAPTPTG